MITTALSVWAQGTTVEQHVHCTVTGEPFVCHGLSDYYNLSCQRCCYQ